jgi:aspartate ammonia-lyase
MTLGQEFKTYSIMVDEDVFRLREAQELLKQVNLGATAIGTGINTKEHYRKLVIKNLRKVTGIDLDNSGDLIEATQDTGIFVHVSGLLKRVVIKMSKVANDLRLLSSGPRAGFNEINLPPLQPGSSIMPGKVNPVIPEVINQVAFEVIGADTTISIACEGGQLQLNVFEPLIAYKLFTSINMMRRSFDAFADKCIQGITANEDVCMNNVLNSITIITYLNPVLGYETCSAVAKEALQTNRRVYDLILEKKLVTQERLDELLLPKNMLKLQE